MAADDRCLNVLAVEPFFGGSHRTFLENAMEHSRHRWRLVTGKPVHWKWRMRSAPVSLMAETAACLANGFVPDVVLCTDMLDLPAWRGMLRDPLLLNTPTAIYFHENQWTYPVAPQARVDHHFGYTNLLSALAADRVLFNSRFHQQTFLSASEDFLRRMPDGAAAHDLQWLAHVSTVVPPGFAAPNPLPTRHVEHPFTLGWVARWEHDKRPDRFEWLLDRLTERGVAFRLVLLGPRPRNPVPELESIRHKYGSHLRFDGFAENLAEYWQRLSEIDVVVSTADHEFFGIAICEAIWAGAVPVLPNRLSYPELAPESCLYGTNDEAFAIIDALQNVAERRVIQAECRNIIESLHVEHTTEQLDDLLASMTRNDRD